MTEREQCVRKDAVFDYTAGSDTCDIAKCGRPAPFRCRRHHAPICSIHISARRCPGGKPPLSTAGKMKRVGWGLLAFAGGSLLIAMLIAAGPVLALIGLIVIIIALIKNV